MSILRSGEVAKVCIVGESGSGKSTLAELTAWATGLMLVEPGEWMRILHPELETKPYQPTVEDDVYVDGKILEFLRDPDLSFVMHGRTTRPLAKKEISEGRLAKSSYFHVALECGDLTMGTRALPKLRKKLNKPDLTVVEAATVLHERDVNDFKRYHERLGVSHQLHKMADLYRTNDPVTDGLPLDSGILTPMQELTNVLWMLKNADKLIPGGVVIGLCRAMAFRETKRIQKFIKKS